MESSLALPYLLLLVAVASVVAIVSITSIIAVLTVFSVTVVVAVLLLGHIDAVDDDTDVRKFLFFAQLVDESECSLRCIVGTAQIYCDVAHASYLQGIGNETYGAVSMMT